MYSPGAVEEYLYALNNALASNNLNTVVVCTNDFILDKYYPINFTLKKFFFLGKSGESKIEKGIKYLYSFLRFLMLIIVFRPTILHIQWFKVIQFELIFFKILKLFGVKIIYTAHDVHPFEYNDRILHLYKKLYQTPDLIIIHSEKSKQDIIRLLDVDEKKINTIRFGNYDFIADKFHFNEEESRKKIGLNNIDNVLLFFGSVRNYKGVEYLLAAFKRIKENNIVDNLKLIFAGGGNWKFFSIDQVNLEYIKNNQDIIADINYIYFYDKVPIYFSAADVLVLPYRNISMSAVLTLSYAYSKPVIATKVGGFPEYVQDGETGFLIEPENVDALVHSIKKAFDDKEKLRDMGRKARLFAEKEMDWNTIALKTIELYKTLKSTIKIGK